MPVATNDMELHNMVMRGIEASAVEISDTLTEIVKDNVQYEVYDAYNPLVYERRHEIWDIGFYESWIYIPEKSESNSFAYKVFSDEESMTEADQKATFGLDDMLVRAHSYDYMPPEYHANPDSRKPYYEPRDYWTPAMDQFRDEEVALVIRVLTNNGFEIIRVGI